MTAPVLASVLLDPAAVLAVVVLGVAPVVLAEEVVVAALLEELPPSAEVRAERSFRSLASAVVAEAVVVLDDALAETVVAAVVELEAVSEACWDA